MTMQVSREGEVQGAKRQGAGLVNHMNVKTFQYIADIWVEKEHMIGISEFAMNEGEVPMVCVCVC